MRARRQRRLGELILQEGSIPAPDPAALTTALLQGIRQEGLACLPWTNELRAWQARVQFLRRVEGPGSTWPDVSDAALLDGLETWLAPFVRRVLSLEQLQRTDLQGSLQGLLSWDQQRALDRLAPTHLTVPSGSRIRVDYESQDAPILAVRLQEMFGCRETPTVAGGRVPVVLHLLSPAGRPAQVTQDLVGFWRTSYQEVKKDLRGRYPKHHWPDNPLEAAPTRRTRHRG